MGIGGKKQKALFVCLSLAKVSLSGMFGYARMLVRGADFFRCHKPMNQQKATPPLQRFCAHPKPSRLPLGGRLKRDLTSSGVDRVGLGMV